MPQERFAMMLEMQRELQLKMPPPNRVPADLRGEERATFVTWNMFAIEDELHEAIAEMGWKPWATSRHLNVDAMLKEMIDAWHFFMNVLLVIAGEAGWTTEQLADEFTKRYIAKNAVNAQRQEEGYDGVSTKCPICKRELSEVEQLARVSHTYDGKVIEFCSREHLDQYEEQFAGAVAREDGVEHIGAPPNIIVDMAPDGPLVEPTDPPPVEANEDLEKPKKPKKDKKGKKNG